MKKKLMLILALCLILALSVAIVACNPQEEPQDTQQNEYEVPKYTVTFDTASSDVVIKNSVLTDIPYGTKIQPPKTSDGKESIPVKTGYTFECWTLDGVAFEFATTPITRNITLKAKYTANTYYHTPVLTAKYDYATSKVIEDARPVGEVSISSAELDKNTTTLKSTYDAATSSTVLTCPTIENKSFCFWYYIDDNGKPVQFTTWRGKGASTVSALTKYTFTKPLKLYPMFDDNLPKVAIEYYVDEKSETPLQVGQGVPDGYIIGQNVPLSDKLDPMGQNPEHKFNYWYYLKETTDNKGNVTVSREEFKFEDIQNPGAADEKVNEVGTSPSEAANTEDNFTPATLKLYGSWTLQVKISSVSDYKNKLYDKLRKEEPTEDELAEIEEILSSEITLFDINFGAEEFEPLFDAEHPFVGTIKGGVSEGATLKGGVFGNATHASVFGYVSGKISGIKIQDLKFKIDCGDDGFANSVIIGALATVNKGEISNCYISFGPDAVSGLGALHTVYFGGLAGRNMTSQGKIEDCTVVANGLVLGAMSREWESLSFGGIVSENGVVAKISRCNADIGIIRVYCVDDGVSSNGKSSLTLGGIAAVCGGFISGSQAEFYVSGATCYEEFTYGGAVGFLSGKVETTSAVATLKDAQVGGSNISDVALGGLAGKNEGVLLNCYVTVDINAAATSQISGAFSLLAGGLVGSNYSIRKDPNSKDYEGVSVINKCYGVGSVEIVVSDETKGVTVYAGGITGRNNNSKITSVFSYVEVGVQNKNTNYVGFMVGKMDKNSSGSDPAMGGYWFYANEADLTLNGVKYVAPEGEKPASFEANTLGTATAGDNLKSVEFVIGSETELVSSQLKFNGEIWQVLEDSYPTLK